MVAAMKQSEAGHGGRGILSVMEGCEILRRLWMTKGMAGLRLESRIVSPTKKVAAGRGCMRSLAARCAVAGRR
jgi:hypothetical protein